jgi:N-formylmaleamate deformylase
MTQRPLAGERASHVVLANDVWQHALEYGSAGPTLVVIPGITSPAASWASTAARLAGAHRVIVVDLRGRGLSDRPAGSYSLQSYAADVRALSLGLHLSRPVIVGHSLGARVAAALDVQFPGLAGGLVLVDPPLSGPGRAPYPFPLSMYDELLDAASGSDADLARLRQLEPGHDDTQLAARLRWLRTIDRRAVHETYEGFGADDFFELWRGISAPAILARGGESPVVTATAAAELSQARPDIPVTTIAGAGHLVHLDDPDSFVTAVRTFAGALAVLDALSPQRHCGAEDNNGG